LALLLRALLMIIGSVILLLLLDWQLTIIVLVTLVLAGLIIWVTMRLARPIFSVVQRKLAGLNTIVQENLAGVRVVKAYARERFEEQRFGKANMDYADENIRVGRIMAVVTPTLLVLTNVASALIIWFGGLDAINGRLTVGELVAFNSYLMIGMAPLLLLGNILMMVSRADASSERVLEVLNTQPAISIIPDPHRAERITGRVTFENVAFGYNAPQNGAGRTGRGAAVNGHAPELTVAHEDVLSGVSFSVESGQRVALLGATGAGKSTLVNLIPRFYDVAGGRICVDDVDVRDWEPRTLRAQVGMVLQQTTLFSGTIRENIAYGRPDAPLEEVIAAAKAAQAHDFIMSMADGYESSVGARGTNLSGGQRQRIAIARALLLQPGILILDDSTSSVDLDTEVKIQDALEELMSRSTTFVVAQRINSVLNAHQILVLDDGRIVDRGNHAELLKSSEIYRDIYRSQIGGDAIVEEQSAG
ncbi:MAG: ABC transporter ATP-binding protein, partial [Caldilineaceae bacterium]|nr:ABC transporter ATP-binding protein [Caldilineaceae bacterium]